MIKNLLKYSSILLFAILFTGCTTYLTANLKPYIVGTWVGDESSTDQLEYKMTFLPFNLLLIHIKSGDGTISNVFFQYRCVTADSIDVIGRFTDEIHVSRLNQDTIIIGSTNGFFLEAKYFRKPPLVMQWSIVVIILIALGILTVVSSAKIIKSNKPMQRLG
jgi:hypothetical protein